MASNHECEYCGHEGDGHYPTCDTATPEYHAFMAGYKEGWGEQHSRYPDLRWQEYKKSREGDRSNG